MEPETVEVHIFATELLRYSATKKIPKSVYDAYCAMADRLATDDEFAEIADRVLDPLLDDPQGNGIEDLEITLVKRS